MVTPENFRTINKLHSLHCLVFFPSTYVLFLGSPVHIRSFPWGVLPVDHPCLFFLHPSCATAMPPKKKGGGRRGTKRASNGTPKNDPKKGGKKGKADEAGPSGTARTRAERRQKQEETKKVARMLLATEDSEREQEPSPSR